MGGDGGIGGPGGDVGSMGSAGYGGGFGNAVSFDGNTPGYGTASGIGEGVGGGIGAAPGGPSYYNNATQMGPRGMQNTSLGTPYPTMPSAPTWGSGGKTSFNYPTPQEVHDQVYGLPYMQNQSRILGNMESMPAFRSAVMPEIQGVMKTLGRSGIPSSSMADRMITDTMGSLYNKWMWNVLTGYQNMGAQLPTMMNQWYQPYNTMLNYVGS